MDTRIPDDAADDLDLNSLNDEELVEQVHDDLYNGLKDEVDRGDEPLPRPRLGADRS